MIPLVLILILHAPGGHEISVNVDKIVSMRTGEGGDKNKHVTGDARCLINTSDGKFINVVETCAEVRRLIGQ